MAEKILVVEDEAHFERLILQRFRKMIREKEYEFIFAQNGVNALEKLEEHRDIKLILSDINMPTMDGLTFIARLLEKKVNAKVVMVSAYGDMQNIRKAMNLGAYDFVTKPINFVDLEITIEKALKEINMLRRARQAQQELTQLQQELAVAGKIQQSILSKNFNLLPLESPFELYAEMIPAKDIGGDFYDFFLFDADHLVLLVGDVSGKGIPAALFMAFSRTLLKATGLKDGSPALCLEQVNYLLSQDNSADLFVTVFYAMLDIKSGELEYCSGGHNPPLLVLPDGELRYLDDSQHLPLGIDESISFQAQKTTLEPGTALIMYTDGITEAVNRENGFFSEKRLEDFIRTTSEMSAREIVKGGVDAVRAFAAGMPQSDDITMMAVKRVTFF